MRKSLFRVLASLFALCMLLAACSDASSSATSSSSSPSAAGGSSASGAAPVASDEDRWYAPYDETVTVRVALATNAAAVYPEGDSASENVWTRGLLEERNIDIEVMWEALAGVEDYNTKLNLAIADNDLPDIISFPDFGSFQKCVDAGLLEDMTVYYEDYASPMYKQFKQDEGSLEWGRVGGQLLGIAQTGANLTSMRMVFLREDWFLETGLPAPETMEDVIEIAKAMADGGENRWALPLNKELVGLSDMCDIVGIANAMGQKPQMFYDDGTGNLVYGSVQPGMKDVLALYAGLVADGYIDPAFPTLDGGMVGEQLTSGQIGALYSATWLPSWPLNSLWDTDGVNWLVYPVMASEANQNPMQMQTAVPQGAMFAVRKGFEHPEALLKILNFGVSKASDPDTAEPLKYHSNPEDEATFGTAYAYHMWFPLGSGTLPGDPMGNFNTAIRVTEAIDTGDESVLITPHDIQQFPSTKAYFDAVDAGEKPSIDSWVKYKTWYGPESTYGVLNNYLDAGVEVVDALTGYQTETMVRSWPTLKDMELQYFTEIISGARPLDDFDVFVQAWMDAGGTMILDEVNAWYAAR